MITSSQVLVWVRFTKSRIKVPTMLSEAVVDEISIDTAFAFTNTDALPN